VKQATPGAALVLVGVVFLLGLVVGFLLGRLA
jgi:hypothetical protein